MRACAIVLAAGKGTRMRSDLPKVLHPFYGVPLILHPLRTALAAGISPIVAVVGHGAEQVRRVVETSLAGAVDTVRFAIQSEQRGTGHAVQCALSVMSDLHGPCLILSGDVPLVTASTLRRLSEAACYSGAGASLATFCPADPGAYGRILRGDRGRVVAIREYRDATADQRAITECNAGIYCFDLDRLRQFLPNLGQDNAQGEIYLTDVVAAFAEYGDVAGLEIDPTEAAGINSPEELAELEQQGLELGDGTP